MLDREKVKAWRIEHGYTMEEVALMIGWGCNKNIYWQWESGLTKRMGTGETRRQREARLMRLVAGEITAGTGYTQVEWDHWDHHVLRDAEGLLEILRDPMIPGHEKRRRLGLFVEAYKNEGAA